MHYFTDEYCKNYIENSMGKTTLSDAICVKGECNYPKTNKVLIVELNDCHGDCLIWICIKP